MKRMLGTVLVVFALSGALAQEASFRGENFSGKFEQENLLKEWPADGPEKILQIDGAGTGWGSAVLIDEQLYVIGKKRDSLDVLSCFGPDGTVSWEAVVGKSWNQSHPDARSTPTVDGQRIYAQSGIGELKCFNRADGTVIWSKNVDSVYQADWHRWGVSESPLVDGDLVIVTPTGKVTTMVAMNKQTGEEVWKSRTLHSKRTYASPVVFETDNFKQVVGLTAEQVFGVNVASGEIEWVYPILERIEEIQGKKPRGDIFPNSPIIKDHRIYVTGGYDNISVMLEVSEDGNQVDEIWVDRTLDCHHGGVVEVDGLIFGSNSYGNRDGMWVSLDWQTGEVKFLTRWVCKGPIVTADGLLYLYDEKEGNVGIAKPEGEELEIISSFKVDYGEGQYWAHPFISDGKLVIRHGESIGIYDIRAGN